MQDLVGGSGGGADGERVEQSADLVEGERDQAGRGRCAVAFGGGDHGQERHREHAQHGPAVPRRPGPDLVLIQTGLALGGLERLLDGPPLSGHPDQLVERDRPGLVAPVVGQFAGGIVAAPKDPGLSGVGGGQFQVRPGLHPVSLGTDAGGQPLPTVWW